MKYKNSIHSFLLIIFAVGSGSYILFGKRGMSEYFALKQELETELNYVHEMEQTYIQLQAHATAWEENSFELEKQARHDLQMGYTNELLYYFPHEYAGTQTVQAATQNYDQRIA